MSPRKYLLLKQTQDKLAGDDEIPKIKPKSNVRDPRSF